MGVDICRSVPHYSISCPSFSSTGSAQAHGFAVAPVCERLLGLRKRNARKGPLGGELKQTELLAMQTELLVASPH